MVPIACLLRKYDPYFANVSFRKGLSRIFLMLVASIVKLTLLLKLWKGNWGCSTVN